MSIRAEHELHSRRRGRNLGVGLILGGFVLLVMALTYVKVTQTDFNNAPGSAAPVGAAQETN